MKAGRQRQRRQRTAGPDGSSGRPESRRQSSGRDLRLQVDRVVLEGLPRSDGALLGRELERELADRLRTTGVAVADSRTFDRIDAGEIRVGRHDRAASIAAELARIVGERIER